MTNVTPGQGVTDGPGLFPIPTGYLLANISGDTTLPYAVPLSSLTIDLDVGTTTITGGTTTRVLYDNAGVLGEYAISGTGSVAMTSAPSLSGIVGLTGAAPASGLPTNAIRIGSGQTDPANLFYRGADLLGIIGAGDGTSFSVSVMADNNGTNFRRLEMFVSSTAAGIFSNWASGAIPFQFGSGIAQWSVASTGTITSISGTGIFRGAALGAGGSDFTITAVNSVSPTAPDRTVTFSYNGTTYYLAAKTTND